MFYNEKNHSLEEVNPMSYNDVFVEQLVKHKLRLKNIVIKILAILLGVVVTLTAWLITPTYSYILFTAAWILAYFIFRSQDYEFEYTFTNGEIDVDRIVAQRQRKRVLSTNCRAIDLMAPYDEAHKHLADNYVLVRTVDYSSSPKAEGRWFFIFTGTSGVKVMVIIEPTRRMLEAFLGELKDKVRQ